jgi:hypothetical protein
MILALSELLPKLLLNPIRMSIAKIRVNFFNKSMPFHSYYNSRKK